MHWALVSLVGNDPAPGAMGARVFLRRFAASTPAPRVFLVRDHSPEEPLRRSRLEALQGWLHGLGFRVEWVDLGFVEGHQEPLVLNLTGGDKATFFRLYRLASARGWPGFLIEAHGAQPVLVELSGRVGPLLKEEGLSLEDYLALYARPAGAKPRGEPGRVPPALAGVSWTLLDLEGEEVLYGVEAGRPLVFLPRPHPAFKDQVNRLREKAKRLGGQQALGVALLPMDKVLGQHENNREWVLAHYQTYAREAGVLALDPREEGALGRALSLPSPNPGAKGPPFRPPEAGPVLLGLLSEQPIPLLASFLVHRPKEVLLVSTQDLERRLGRLASAQEAFSRLGARVQVRQVSGPWALDEVEALFAPVLGAIQARGLSGVANLAGGTKAMALGLLRVLPPGFRVEYLRGSTLEGLLEGDPLPVPWAEVGPEAVLHLYGYQLERDPELGQIQPHQEVLARAEEFLRHVEDPQRARAFLEAWEKSFAAEAEGFRLRWRDLRSSAGLALEYLAFFHLHRLLTPRGARVEPGAHLRPLRAHSGLNPREVDGLVWHRGSLAFVECKPDLRSALSKHQEDAALFVLQENFGGMFGRGLLLVRRGRWKPHEKPPAELPWVLRNPRLRLLSLKGGTAYPEGRVYAFPEELEEALRDWGWP